MFGGNSNWRGPVWMPVNILIIRALLQYYRYYGDGFTIECPTGSGRMMNLFEVSREISGRSPAYSSATATAGARLRRDGKIPDRPHWRDNILFYDYFPRRQRRGPRASHQTGWTGIVAKLIQLFHSVDARTMLESDSRRCS
jgi:hypothetical protein